MSNRVAYQEILRRRANIEISWRAQDSNDAPRDIIHRVLGDEADHVNDVMPSDASLKRKLVYELL